MGDGIKRNVIRSDPEACTHKAASQTNHFDQAFNGPSEELETILDGAKLISGPAFRT